MRFTDGSAMFVVIYATRYSRLELNCSGAKMFNDEFNDEQH